MVISINNDVYHIFWLQRKVFKYEYDKGCEVIGGDMVCNFTWTYRLDGEVHNQFVVPFGADGRIPEGWFEDMKRDIEVLPYRYYVKKGSSAEG